MHRLGTVRRQQRVSLDEVAQRLSLPLEVVLSQESEGSNPRLSELWAWQEVLGIPVERLLIDPGGLVERPLLERSKMSQLLKIASRIRDEAATSSVLRAAEVLVAQLREMQSQQES
jgi:transcriptional regulator with XRE-family HTH domain